MFNVQLHQEILSSEIIFLISNLQMNTGIVFVLFLNPKHKWNPILCGREVLDETVHAVYITY